jgi:hypothetical protein
MATLLQFVPNALEARLIFFPTLPRNIELVQAGVLDAPIGEITICFVNVSASLCHTMAHTAEELTGHAWWGPHTCRLHPILNMSLNVLFPSVQCPHSVFALPRRWWALPRSLPGIRTWLQRQRRRFLNSSKRR